MGVVPFFFNLPLKPCLAPHQWENPHVTRHGGSSLIPAQNKRKVFRKSSFEWKLFKKTSLNESIGNKCKQKKRTSPYISKRSEIDGNRSMIFFSSTEMLAEKKELRQQILPPPRTIAEKIDPTWWSRLGQWAPPYVYFVSGNEYGCK